MIARSMVVAALLLALLLGVGCEAAEPTSPPVSEATSVSPTVTPVPPTPTATAVSEAPLRSGGLIAFGSGVEDGGVFVMNPDGSGVRRLADGGFPSWSPDGSQIVYTVDRNGESELYVMNVDGSNQRSLAEPPVNGGSPAWSPDGQRIAFVRMAGNTSDIFVVDVDGANLRQLTNDQGHNWWPDWSPDGSRIVFSSNRDGDMEIYIMDANGDNVRALTENNSDDWNPAWSPDGERILFASKIDNRNDNIYVINVDGSGLQRLTKHASGDWNPAWSPDGRTILFVSYRNRRDGDIEIYAMDLTAGTEAEGNTPERLTHRPESDETPAWQPSTQTETGAHVWSLGGNGWALRIGERMLVFDYVGRSAPGGARNLQSGYVDPDELRAFDTYVFVTHSHQDHYDPAILGWERQVEKITYFFGWKAGNNPEHHYMVGPRAHAQAGGVEVYTINSHHAGVPEVAFLVKVDGFTIYHNGDYQAEYQKDFEYLRTIADHIDIAFVIGWPYVNHQNFRQAVLLAEMFHPTYMFAINREGDEDKSRQFAELLAAHGVEVKVLYAEQRGDDFICPKSTAE